MHIAALILGIISSSITADLLTQMFIQQQIVYNYQINWQQLQATVRRQAVD